MRTEQKPEVDGLIQRIGQIAGEMQKLARQAEEDFTLEVATILKDQCRDPRRIEHLLDQMLDFCFDSRVLALYKTACRYYLKIDPGATAFYVYAYRDLWDEGAVDSES